jgi:hypothetical protein
MIRQRKQLNSVRHKNYLFCGMTVPKYLRTNSGCSLASEILIKIIPFHLTTFEGRGD